MTLDELFQLLLSLVFALAIFGGVASLAGLMTWGERKLASMIQDRIGPNRANVRLLGRNFTLIGLFHIIADPIKLFTKEDFIPEGANRPLHTLAPMICLFIPLILFSVIPFAGPLHISWKDFPAQEIWGLGYLVENDVWFFGEMFGGDVLHLSDYTVQFVVSDLDVGMLFIFAMASLSIYGIMTAGWASNNKFSFLGAMRGANQMISYELGLGLAAIGIFMVYGSVNLGALVQGQGEHWWGLIPKWGLIVQPLGFLLFLACGVAETKRIPFDLPEGESEIVAGYFTEYSSLKFTMFLFGEYVEMILLSAIITTLFFGGWQLPWIDGSGYEFLRWQGGWEGTWLAGLLTVHGTRIFIMFLQGAKFALFVVAGVYFLLTARWTFPRFRYDQVMKMGWKMVLPLAFLNIVITALVMVVLRGWM